MVLSSPEYQINASTALMSWTCLLTDNRAAECFSRDPDNSPRRMLLRVCYIYLRTDSLGVSVIGNRPYKLSSWLMAMGYMHSWGGKTIITQKHQPIFSEEYTLPKEMDKRMDCRRYLSNAETHRNKSTLGKEAMSWPRIANKFFKTLEPWVCQLAREYSNWLPFWRPGFNSPKGTKFLQVYF